MSQPEHRTVNVADHEKPNHQDAAPNGAQMAQNHEQKTMFNDSSMPLFTMYCKMTKDDKRAENLIKRLDNVVVFMGLFSAIVAGLLMVTFPALKQDPQTKAAFYLESLYELQAPGAENRSIPFIPAQPRFSAPRSAVWVSALLSVSLCIGISAAILALSIREYVPQYIQRSENPQLRPDYRARMREMIVCRRYHSLATWALAVMIFLSLWCFFAAVCIYLFNLNKVIFSLVFCCAWFFIILHHILMYFLHKVKSVSESSARIDDRVLGRLFNALVEDSDLAEFFETIPGFCRSSLVRDPVRRVTSLGKDCLKTAVTGLLKRTWSSNILSDSEKVRRLVVCVNFADAVRLPDIVSSILEEIFPRDRQNTLLSVEMCQFLKSQGILAGQQIGLCAQGIVAGIISNVQEHNDHWIALAADQLGKSEDVIRGYLKCGKDNVLLANLTHITGQIFHSLKDNRDMAASLSSMLPSLANFDVRNTLAELQHDFGALWNDIEQTPNDQVPTEIRDNMLILYDALNGTPSSNTGQGLPDTPSGSTCPDHEAVDKDSKTRTMILSPASHSNRSLSTSSIPKSTRRTTTDATSSDFTSSPLESTRCSDTSESQVLTTATVGKIADTPSRGEPTVWSNPGAASHTMVTSSNARGIVESSPPISTSAPHSTAPEVVSLFHPNCTCTAPLFAHHCAQDLNDRIELESPLLTRLTRHSASSAENLDPSELDNNPA